MKNGKAKGLKQINNTSNKGLFRLGTDINTNDYHVLVQNKKEKKTYEMPFSLFNTGGGGGAYIPLTGTEVDKPVTGNIEFNNVYPFTIGYSSYWDNIGLFYEDDYYKAIINQDGVTYIDNFTGYTRFFQFAGSEYYLINSTDPSFKGIRGGLYYGANYDDNTYVQKKYVDSAIAANSGGQIAFTKTKAEIDALITGNDLVAGALYEITGVHPTLYDDGTTSGTTVYLRAISGSELEVQGMGKFYNPKYNQAVDGFGIWENKMYGTFSSISGTFDYQNKEAVTANNAATGILLADGMIQWVSGDWSTATGITGDVSSATATVAGFVTPTYSIGDKVIWGGYSWTNVNGNVGASTDVLNLNAEWSKNVYDTTNYNIAYDVIEYDYTNDMIIRRFEKESNVDVKCSKSQYDFFVDNYGFTYHTISVQQFGNEYKTSTYKGQLNIDVDNGYNECINFSGAYQQSLTFGSGAGQYNLTFGSGAYQRFLTFGSGAYQQYLTFGNGAYQEYLTFGSSAYQYSLTFGNGAYQEYLTFGSDAYQYNLTFGSGSNQRYLTFGISAGQNNLTFGSNAYQYSLTFGSGAYQENLTFGSDAGQENLTFGSSAYQRFLTFGERTQLDFDNQTVNSNMEYVSFKTKNITVPDLSAATYIFDGNIKEVYQRPDNALKIRYYDNSDVLQIVDIDD